MKHMLWFNPPLNNCTFAGIKLLNIAPCRDNRENMKKKKDQLIYGLHPVIEAIEAGKDIDRLLVKKGLQGELFSELASRARKYNVPMQFVPQEKLNRETSGNHQGVIAYISLIEYTSLDMLLPAIYEKGETPFFVVLDGITDVRNFGSIARSASCAGVHGIIIPAKGGARVNSDAIKTSAGALNHLPVCRVNDLHASVKFLKNSGLAIYTASEKANHLYTEPDYNIPLAIIMGAEDKGVTPKILGLSDDKVKIPLKGEISSLNVSVAAAILMFEVVKNRNL